MIIRLLAAALVLFAVLTPAAHAQDTPASPVQTVEGAPDSEQASAPVQNRYPLSVDPDLTHDPENILFLDLSNGKRVAIRLVPQWAPKHVERIKTLTRQGFYDGVIFHRVIDGFMAQTGDPTGTGQGGSELPDLEAEFNVLPHVRGTVSMARASDKNSANSQFFIMFYPRFSLDRNYTNFGRVIGGMDGVDAIERGEPPAKPTFIVQASIAADNKPQKFAPPPEPAAQPPIEVPAIPAD
jgi:peptidylprolyl isomerase